MIKLPMPKTKDEMKQFLDRYYWHPERFVREMLQVTELDEYFQPHMLQAVADHKHVAIKGGKGAGKTWTLGAISIWWKATRAQSKVLLMANTSDQATSTIFGYVKQLIENSCITDWFVVTAENVSLRGDLPGFAIKPGSISHKGEAGAGKHAKNMLVICDEAEGFETERWDILMGNMTEENAQFIASGNPTRLHVPFHKIFTEWANDWHLMTVDSRKCKFVSQDWVKRYISIYQNDMTDWHILANILGEFPLQSINAYVLGDNVRAARVNKLAPSQFENYPAVIGVDLAYGGGDASAITIRKGRKIVHVELRQDKNTIILKERVIKLFREHKAIKAVVDITGGGSGEGAATFTDELRPFLPPNSVVPIHFSSKSGNPELFPNKRQELWSLMRDGLRSGLDLSSLPNEIYQRLELELASVETTINKSGQECILPKSEIKKRLGHSPDISDSIALTYAINDQLTLMAQSALKSAGGWVSSEEYSRDSDWME